MVISLSNILHSVGYAPLFSPHLSTLYGTLTKPQVLVVWARALEQMSSDVRATYAAISVSIFSDRKIMTESFHKM